MTNPAIPERIKPDLSDGIEGVRFRYIENKCDDRKREMSQLLYDGLQVLCRKLSDIGVVRIIHQGIYNPRRVRGGSRWSNHAYALAIDLWGFEFDDRSIVRVLDWKPRKKHPVIEEIAALCRRLFGEVVGPDAGMHADHIHAGYHGSRYIEQARKYRKIFAKMKKEELDPDWFFAMKRLYEKYADDKETIKWLNIIRPYFD